MQPLPTKNKEKLKGEGKHGKKIGAQEKKIVFPLTFRYADFHFTKLSRTCKDKINYMQGFLLEDPSR